MRITGQLNNGDHWSQHFRSCPVVKLDGVVIDHVAMADDAAGVVEIVRYVHGKPAVERDGFVYCTMKGKVEIIGDRHDAVGDRDHNPDLKPPGMRVEG